MAEINELLKFRRSNITQSPLISSYPELKAETLAMKKVLRYEQQDMAQQKGGVEQPPYKVQQSINAQPPVSTDNTTTEPKTSKMAPYKANTNTEQPDWVSQGNKPGWLNQDKEE